MNEVFLQLAEEAGFDVQSLSRYPGGFPREDIIVLQDFYNVIVERCVAAADEWYHNAEQYHYDVGQHVKSCMRVE